jgi:hypothetical protein
MWSQGDVSTGGCAAFLVVLGADIDHMGFALLIEMRKFAHFDLVMGTYSVCCA